MPPGPEVLEITGDGGWATCRGVVLEGHERVSLRWDGPLGHVSGVGNEKNPHPSHSK